MTREWAHCATCGGEMPVEKWAAHEAWHAALAEGSTANDYAVRADAIYHRPPEWTLSVRRLTTSGEVDRQLAIIEALRAIAERL